MEEVTVTGIILYTTTFGEYDKRLVILTKERGKITVFSNGARRTNSTLRAASQSYVMGQFTLIPRRDSYNLVEAKVSEYFSGLSADIEKMCYAAYFSEFMSYYTREGDSCVNNLNLLYVTLKALIDEKVPKELIRYIYELRLMYIEGQGLNAYSCVKCGRKDGGFYFDARSGGLLCEKCAKGIGNLRRVSDTVRYTLQYIVSKELSSLYSFNITEDALYELGHIANQFSKQYVDKTFNSLDILSSLS